MAKKIKINETKIGDEILTDDGLMEIADLIRLAEFYKSNATHLSIDRYFIEDEEGVEHMRFSFQFVKRTNEK